MSEQSNESMKCSYTYNSTNKRCIFDIYDEKNKLCIFHSKKETQTDKNIFIERFNSLLIDSLNNKKMDKIDCSEFIFTKISFPKIKISKNIKFSNSLFNDEIDFNNIEFLEVVDFSNCIFLNNAYFYKSKFNKDVNFQYCRFKKFCSFKEAVFNGVTDFFSSEFESIVNFWNSKFFNTTIFQNVYLRDECTFDYAEFNYDNDRDFEKYFDFRYVTIDRPEKVSFVNVDFERFLFAWTINIDKIEITDVKFIKKKNRIFVYDEIDTKISKEFNNFQLIERIYNRFRSNYENSNRYGEGGEFHISEMEMRRKQLGIGIVDKEKSKVLYIITSALSWLRQNIFSFLAMYKLFSLYGERYSRSFICLLLILVLFSGVFLLQGLINSENSSQIINIQNSTTSLKQFMINYYESVRFAIYSLASSNNNPWKLQSTYQDSIIVFRALMLTVFTLFVLAIRRRFKR